MKVLVTGVNGQLGHDVMNELAKRGYEGVGVDVAEMDITDAEAVRRVMEEVRPDKMVHCAAWTAVDAAEDEVEMCRKVNAEGTENIARMCGEMDIPMIYLSTDYVFDGQGTRPWYYIVRIAWVFGVNGKNFIKTMLNLGKTHDTLTVVDDQIGTPTYTYDLARLLVDMLEKEEYGKYHVTNEGGYISWCDFAKEIFRQAGMNVTVTPVSSDQYPAKAKRPSNSRLEKKKLTEHGFTRLPDWQDALARYLKEIM